MEDFVDFEGHGLAGPHVGAFVEPAVFDGWVGDFCHDVLLLS